MVGISFDNYVDKSSIRKREYVCSLLGRRIFKVLNGNKYGTCYLNCASYYMKPISDDSMGFGSGKLEIRFSVTDNEEEIKRKLSDYLAKTYTEKIAYTFGEAGKKAKEEVDQWCRW